jgi:hypothetical protein
MIKIQDHVGIPQGVVIRWFKFVATTAQINRSIIHRRSRRNDAISLYGTVASDGTTQVGMCKLYISVFRFRIEYAWTKSCNWEYLLYFS